MQSRTLYREPNLALAALGVIIGLFMCTASTAAPHGTSDGLCTLQTASARTKGKMVLAAPQSASQGVCSTLWTGAGVFGNDSGHKCEIHMMQDGEHLGGARPPKLCIRDYPDMLADQIRVQGFWQDCPALSKQWVNLPDRSGKRNFDGFTPCGHLAARPNNKTKVFVEIGANIGACLMQMLSRGDVHNVVAFEPMKSNLFYLTSSVLANPPLQSKLQLFASALGEASRTSKIYEEKGNPGNSMVGAGPESGLLTGGVKSVDEIPVHTLDEVFMSGREPPYIHLMKMDAQGYEVKILQGAQKLLATGAVNAVKFELASQWLEKQGASSAQLFNVLLNNGYTIYDEENLTTELTNELLKQYGCGAGIIKDFVAVRRDPSDATQQKQIVC